MDLAELRCSGAGGAMHFDACAALGKEKGGLVCLVCTAHLSSATHLLMIPTCVSSQASHRCGSRSEILFVFLVDRRLMRHSCRVPTTGKGGGRRGGATANLLYLCMPLKCQQPSSTARPHQVSTGAVRQCSRTQARPDRLSSSALPQQKSPSW